MKLIQSKVVNRKATICLSNVVRIDESSIQFRKQAIVSSIPTKKKKNMSKNLITVFRREQIQKTMYLSFLKAWSMGFEMF